MRAGTPKSNDDRRLSAAPRQLASEAHCSSACRSSTSTAAHAAVVQGREVVGHPAHVALDVVRQCHRRGAQRRRGARSNDRRATANGPACLWHAQAITAMTRQTSQGDTTPTSAAPQKHAARSSNEALRMRGPYGPAGAACLRREKRYRSSWGAAQRRPQRTPTLARPASASSRASGPTASSAPAAAPGPPPAPGRRATTGRLATPRSPTLLAATVATPPPALPPPWPPLAATGALHGKTSDEAAPTTLTERHRTACTSHYASHDATTTSQ